MRYLCLILIIACSSCLMNNKSSEEDKPKAYVWESDTSNTRSIEALVGDVYQLVDSTLSSNTCKAKTLFTENLTLPLDVNYDFFTMFDNIGEKIAIPYECIKNGELDLHNGLPVNIYYAYGKIELEEDYYLVIQAVNPENPVDLFYTSAIIFTNNNGVLEKGIEIGKYHAYSGVQEYYDGQLNKDGTINQHIKKIGNDGISESVFEERDTSFNIIK